MSDERFVCIDVGYGDDWYITDNGKRLSEMEIVGLLNEQDKEIGLLRHELDSLTGCYCADNKEFKEYWRIGYDE